VEVKDFGDTSIGALSPFQMITVQKCRRNERTLNKAQITTLLVLEKLISKRLITFNLCDDGSNFDTEFATCFQASAAIDQVVAIAFQWADQDRHTLTVLGNRVLQALNFNLKPVIQPSFGNNLRRIDLKYTATQSAPFKCVRSVAKGLQRQTKFRLSCHSAPMCSG